MAVRDIFHEAVKHALVKDGWTITHDPLALSFGEIDLYIDLGAERVLSAERAGQRIAVEIKSFNGPSLVSNFHTALGQFLNYRLALDNVRSAVSIIFGCSVRCPRFFLSLAFYPSGKPPLSTQIARV